MLVQRQKQAPWTSEKYSTTRMLSWETADISNYFFNKINNIRTELNNYPEFEPPVLVKDVELCAFNAITEDDVIKLIIRTKPTTCMLDPAPSKVVKQNIDILAPFITIIINESLTIGCFSREWKTSTNIPVLRKDNLDHALKNYRPVNTLDRLCRWPHHPLFISYQVKTRGRKLSWKSKNLSRKNEILNEQEPP